MNLAEAEAKFPCSREASERLIGTCDHVAFEVFEPTSADGIAHIRFQVTGEESCLALSKVVTECIHDAARIAEVDLDDFLDLSVKAVALVALAGNWYRKGSPVPV